MYRPGQPVFINFIFLAVVSELADEADSKSVVGSNVWVRFPPAALRILINVHLHADVAQLAAQLICNQ